MKIRALRYTAVVLATFAPAAVMAFGQSEDEVVAAHPTASFDAATLKDVAQFYDDGNMARYRNGDAFVKQVYQQLKPK